MSGGLVQGLDHVSVLVADTGRALEFYRDILGMEVDHGRPRLPYSGAFLDIGDGRQIHLIELPNPDPQDGRPAHGGRDRHTALRITSLDQIIGRLEAANIAFTLSSSGRRALFCRDFDGNAYEFVEA